MIKTHASRTLRFLRTTAIGGVFFLLPLTVIGFLLAQLIQAVWFAAKSMSEILPDGTPQSYTMLFVSGLSVIVLACFLSGIVARRALGQRFTALTEKYLLMLFPRYAIFKEQLSGNIGGKEFRNTMRPALVQFADYKRIAMEIERDESGNVTVFLPGSPDPWSGTIVITQADKVQKLDIPFGEALAAFEQLGRNTLQLTQAKLSTPK